MIRGSALKESVKDLSIKIFEQVAKAESSAHGIDIDRVHFHEIGAVDSILDIVCAAAALDYIGATVACSVIPLGSGTVKTMHGIIPLPAPATLFILKNVPVEGTDIKAELTTPTGAAIIKTCAKSFGTIPPLIPLYTGMGAGERSHAERPGIMRVTLGRPVESSSNKTDDHFVIESNIDDMSGELASAAMERLFANGALDVWFTPIQMKKGRPAITLSALVTKNNLDKIGSLIMRETTTIGIRYYPVSRMEMKRSFKKVNTEYGPVTVKISTGKSEGINISPEFESCKEAADRHNVPVKTVMAEAMAAYSSLKD
jgi:uncharacterized protein (TIGR00299 family) protein